jgi:PadR family transcriptional regulator PadR
MALRLTVQVLLVLRALLRDPGRELYGLELSEETGLQPGTAYPILLRLENEGWVTSRWEDVDPKAEGRPARRYYRLTAGGAVQASAAVAGARRGARGAALRGLAGEGGPA